MPLLVYINSCANYIKFLQCINLFWIREILFDLIKHLNIISRFFSCLIIIKPIFKKFSCFWFLLYEFNPFIKYLIFWIFQNKSSLYCKLKIFFWRILFEYLVNLCQIIQNFDMLLIVKSLLFIINILEKIFKPKEMLHPRLKLI